MKYCSKCGLTASRWVITDDGHQRCPRCRSQKLVDLNDQMIDWEFQAIMERVFHPSERYVFEEEEAP